MVRTNIEKLWRESAPLSVTTILTLVAFVVSAALIFADPRIITGMPAWLKPTKFAISIAIFSTSIAWLFLYVQIWPRFRRISGWIFAIVLVGELVIIDIQAARGTTSHFNVSTRLDGALFSIMGVMILVLWLVSAAIAVMLFKQPFADRTWGWSLRLGMLISVLGAATGGMMISPTSQQVAMMQAHAKVNAVGSHTVGAPDGGPGMPGVGWSTEHGDLRAPHFLGLHALQIIPFIGWIVSRRRGAPRTVLVASASYVALVMILVWQALRGQSILEPDSTTLLAGAVWLLATILGFAWSLRPTGISMTAPVKL